MTTRFALISVSFLLVGCLSEAPDELVLSSTTNGNWWSTRDIPVCFVTADRDVNDTKYKIVLEQTVRAQRSWSKAADINFVGWKRCRSGEGGVRIQFKASNEQTSSIGPSGGVVTMDLNPNRKAAWSVICSGLNNRECQMIVALHEFGHAIGFYHEYSRTDQPTSDPCESNEVAHSDAQLFGPYDSDSIMTPNCSGSRTPSALDNMGAVHFYGVDYSTLRRAGDFDGDRRADRLCHDVASGDRTFHLANGSVLGTSGSCTGDYDALYADDFDGDQQAELACHNRQKDRLAIDGGPVLEGLGCNRDSEHLIIGDFDGDARADIGCHNQETGSQWIELDDNKPGPEVMLKPWCTGKAQWLLVGDFDGRYGDDLACFDRSNGEVRVEYSLPGGGFNGVDVSSTSSLCSPTQQLRVGDFDGDGRDDLVCHDGVNGSISLNLASSGLGTVVGDPSFATAGFCDLVSDQLFVGDYTGDGIDDLLCHNVINGSSRIAQMGKQPVILSAESMCNARADEHL